MKDLLERLGIVELNQGALVGLDRLDCRGKTLESISPIDGRTLAKIRQADPAGYEEVVQAAEAAFNQWRDVPAPRRGEVVRQIGNAFRERKKDLGALISLEMGKIPAEAEGEVQELIDICDFAVGQSRMLYGFSMHSERPGHRMFEQYHPLGPVGVITAFNFPVAVWSWNAMLALVAGDTVVWKPSSKVPLCAIAANLIAARVIKDCGFPQGLLNVLIGKGWDIGGRMAADSAAAADFGHRRRAHGEACRADSSVAAREAFAGAWRQQRRYRYPKRRPRPRPSGRPVRRRWDRRAEVHNHQAADRAELDFRQV